MRTIIVAFVCCVIFCSCAENKRQAQNHIVVIEAMKFQPAEITINSGDTVTWINKDFVEHDVMEEKTKAWSSKKLSSGQQWSMVFTDAADYYCSIHVVMKGKIKVN